MRVRTHTRTGARARGVAREFAHARACARAGARACLLAPTERNSSAAERHQTQRRVAIMSSIAGSRVAYLQSAQTHHATAQNAPESRAMREQQCVCMQSTNTAGGAASTACR
eukprot:14028968-Alexandrium_andersonii.AAC.1